jgi:hypothetical protein
MMPISALSAASRILFFEAAFFAAFAIAVSPWSIEI